MYTEAELLIFLDKIVTLRSVGPSKDLLLDMQVMLPIIIQELIELRSKKLCQCP